MPSNEVKSEGLPFIGKAITPRSRLPYMGDLTPDENERLRQRMKQALETRFKNVTELATAIGRSQPSTSDFLNGKGGASIETARRFAGIVKIPVWEILGETVGPKEAPTRGAVVEYDDQFPNRAHAIMAARLLKIPERAIEPIQSARYANWTDVEPMGWFEEIQSIERRLSRNLPLHFDDVSASDLDVEPPGFDDPPPKKGKGKK